MALALLQVIVSEGISPAQGGLAGIVARLGGRDAAARSGLPEQTLGGLARAFVEGKGIALAAAAADESPAAADAAFAAALLNHLSGSIGAGVDFSSLHALSTVADPATFTAFLDRLSSPDVLIVHDTNLAYTAPLQAQKLRRAGLLVYLGTLPDETAELADWVLPLDYPLEAWGDYAPYQGIESLQQPTMARLYDTRHPGDIFALLASGHDRRPFRERLFERWERLTGERLEDLLRVGGRYEEEGGGGGASLRGDAAWSFAPEQEGVQAIPAASILLYDGRTANRGWIQETPDPVSTVVWGGYADLHPSTARELRVEDGDLVELAAAAGAVRLPARLTEGVAPGSAAVLLGQGHSARGLSIAAGIGANGFALQFGPVELRRAGGSEELVRLSATLDQHRRHILQSVPLKDALASVRGAGGMEVTLPLPEGYRSDRDLYPPHDHKKHRWGMVVDLHRCIGCGACAVACYAENNVAYVGKKRCAEGREMAWLKVVPYRMGDSPFRVRWLPMLCQHCDAAPCEPVCPVYAAVHTEEGLNAQVYNRCIGTRYCSNNCPYKVRRFNWYRREWPAPLDLQLNPEVTVRSQGVMEKCTFCVQRIREAEYRARLEKRGVRDGEIVPACAQTCPAGVYTFGDLMDPASRVSRLTREDPRRYQVLHELNTKPAVTYLKAVEQEVIP